MDKVKAKKLVEKTFNGAYNKEEFRIFINQLAGHASNEFEWRDKTYVGNSLPDSHERLIESCKYLCRFVDGVNQIGVFVVKLRSFKTLERARSFQRNFIARQMQQFSKDAALVAFYTDENPEWRFSLVQVQYKLEKGKVKKEITSAKRSSFLVGAGVKKTHTAQQQLSSLLTLDNVSLQQLEKAFSVEPVTEEFYKRYKELYESLFKHLQERMKAGLKFKDKSKKTIKIKPEDFAKHLMGQLVFLYFLQKKGWLGAEEGKDPNKGKKNFLRYLFEQRGDKNFYDDILTYLLHEALATERQSVDYYYEKFDCSIPYLNGGLFEPFCGHDWQDKYLKLNISNDIFSKENSINEEDKGIFDVFDNYNFTVREDEPLENEVAIDPEMLGKIFENLIPENERKGSGTFYTPRKIVYYMCQESITDYLHRYFKDSKTLKDIPREDIEEFIIECDIRQEHNAKVQEKKKNKEPTIAYKEFKIPESIKQSAQEIDKALQDVRVCDPAIGSGAFPVAMMLEIARLRIALDKAILGKEITDYSCKRHCIENCLYGVDLDPSAVDIARLRLWLSLVVDEESFENIDPLPNLDYKIVQANALRGFVLKTEKLKKQLKELTEAKAERLTEAKDEYKSESSFNKKRALRKEIDEIFDKIYNNPDMLDSSPYKVDFDFEVHFFEVFDEKKGFDIVIANPPYIQLQKDGSKLAKFYENCDYDSFAKSGDIYALFYEEAIDILRQGGVFAYITSNKWMRANYGKNLRRVLTFQTKPLTILDLGSDAFDTATVDTNILITRKEKPSPKEPFHAVILHDHKSQDSDLYQYMQDEENVVKMRPPENDEQWLILTEPEYNLLKKIESKGKALKDLGVVINSGVKTGYNEAFVIDSETKNKLIDKDSKSKELIKPALRGRDIDKWYPAWQDKWLITTFPELNKDIDDYPAIKNYLLEEFGKDRLEQTGENRARKKTSHKWFESQDPIKYHEEFKKEKIIYPELNQSCSFVYDKDNYYLLNSAYMMTSGSVNLKNLTAFLNSNISQFWLFHNCTSLGNRGRRMLAAFLNELPAHKEISSKNELGVITDAITTKGENIETNEAHLNQILYDLYELTDAEIEILKKTVQLIAN